jgi:hypothetical protein
MSLGHGAFIVRDGLVFCYDQGNIDKSWKGAPATNLFTETNLNNWTKTATTSTSQYVTPFDTPSYAITDNNASSYLNIDRTTTVANDTSSYTISLFVRKTYGATSARLGFNIGFSGGTLVATNPRFNSDTGVGTGASIDYGDWWYWYFTITNNGTGNTNLYCQFYPATGVHNGNDDPIGVGTAIVGAFMLVAGSVAARFANGTRSSTQALLDMTGQNTITANSLTYASNNTFSFDGGGSNAIDCGGASAIKPTAGITVSTWIKFNSAAGNNRILSDWHQDSAVDRWIFYTPDSTSVVWYMTSNGQTEGGTPGYSFTPGQWVNLTGTYNQLQQILYVNGVQHSSVSRTGTLKSGNSSQTVRIGRQANTGLSHNGSISNVQIYNRGLTAAEVKQNFEAIRGRYGI